MRRISIALVLCASGCIGTTPDDRTRAALPDDGLPANELHRAGQPCLLCHSDFSVAGTVYAVDGVTPAPLAQVVMMDATGVPFTATTNAAGNFLVFVNDWTPVFPLTVDVTDGDNQIGMRSPISRNGSCAFCHGAQLSATSVGPVVVGALP